MNKAELIAAVAEKSEISKAKAGEVLDALLETITDNVAWGGAVQLMGFGTFSTSKRAARVGRNPATGEAIEVPAKKVVKFKPGKTLSDSVAIAHAAKK
jgi:DNA-binding protein HU-beta